MNLLVQKVGIDKNSIYRDQSGECEKGRKQRVERRRRRIRHQAIRTEPNEGAIEYAQPPELFVVACIQILNRDRVRAAFAGQGLFNEPSDRFRAARARLRLTRNPSI